jgi:hypothetical protein
MLLLAGPVWAEPRTLYTEVYAQLRGVEYDLGLLERSVTNKNTRDVRRLDRIAQSLAEMEAVWAESRQRLDKAKPPKHKELWEKVSQMLAIQQDLATRCAYVARTELSLDQESLKRLKAEIAQLQSDYARVRADLSKRL